MPPTDPTQPVPAAPQPQPPVHSAADPTSPAPTVMPSAEAAAHAPTPVAAPHVPAPVAEPVSNDSDSSEPEESPHTIRRILGFLLSWVIVPGLLVLFVHNFVFQAWYVDGQSMHPSFENGDYLIVSKWDVSLKKLTGQSNNLDIKRGDVVIFNPPSYTSDIYFIKRAIGLPGERVVIRDGSIRIYNAQHADGLAINEPYVGGIALEGDVDQTVPPGQIFVVGDNRQPGASHDSRAIGPIPEDHVIGTADIRLLPVSQFGTVPHPNY